MNDNTFHLSISGLTREQAGEITQKLKLQHGLSLTITDLAQVDDEPEETPGPLTAAAVEAVSRRAEEAIADAGKAIADASQAAHAAESAKLRLDAIDEKLKTGGTVWVDVLPRADGRIHVGSITAADLIANTITEKDLAPGAITHADIDGVQIHPAPAPTPPPARAVPYLGTLVVDLPGNSTALVLGGTYDEAAYGYRDIAASIEQNHPDEIVRVVRANGNEHTVLRNGTVLRPQRRTRAGRVERAADLVIISGYTREYTSDLHHRATHAAAPKAGRIVGVSQTEASAS